MRYSKQREKIFACVQQSTLHPSAMMVYSDLVRSDPRLSLGTVYRNLNQLADAGRLLKIPLSDGSCRFDAVTNVHSHIICETCGRVSDVLLPELTALEHSVEQETGFLLNRYDVVMHGTCKECLNHKVN